jgi:hypothetical protein
MESIFLESLELAHNQPVVPLSPPIYASKISSHVSCLQFVNAYVILVDLF